MHAVLSPVGKTAFPNHVPIRKGQGQGWGCEQKNLISLSLKRAPMRILGHRAAWTTRKGDCWHQVGEADFRDRKDREGVVVPLPPRYAQGS